MLTDSPFTAERRRQILAEVFQIKPELDDFDFEFNPRDKDQCARLDWLRGRRGELEEEYRNGVPLVRLSRCPFCQNELSYPMDNYDFDGLWWAFDRPIMPRVRSYDPHFIGLTGAAMLNPPVPKSPYLVVPGPEVPFVIPRVFKEMNAVAVISQIQIGRHIAYPIAYYVQSLPSIPVPRVNRWGTRRYEYVGLDGLEKAGEAPDYGVDNDYEIDNWISQSRVHWINPGDDSLRLNPGSAACPYVGLKGRRDVVRLQFGETWT